MKTCFLLIAHAPLASALRACALHVFPECDAQVLALDVPAYSQPAEMREAARSLMNRSHAGQVLLLSDVVGATPCNVAQSLVEGADVRLVTGVAMDEAAPVRAFLAQLPVSYPILLESPRTPGAATRFGDRDGLLPYSVLVGTDGRVLDQHLGPLDAAMLQAWLAPPAVSP